MMSELIQDEKAQTILQLLADGKSREEVSQHFEQDWKTLYVYMNRKGFRLDKEGETFVLQSEVDDTPKQNIQTVNTKASQVIRMLDVKHPNIQQVAVKQGFTTIEELGIYMKAQGFLWDDDVQNYVEHQAVRTHEAAIENPSIMLPEGMLDEKGLMHFLIQHQERLIQLLAESDEMSIPTYKFKGNKVNKTLTLASGATALLEDFHKEYNLTQRSVVEVALAEFFIRHGYKEKMGAMLL